MNFIEEFFQDNSVVICQRLEVKGFSAVQAMKFMSKVAEALLRSFKHKDIEEIIAVMSINDSSRLRNSVNTSHIAENIGMNVMQVDAGFEVIAPIMAEAFAHNVDGVVNAAASIAWGSIGDITASGKSRTDK